MHQFHSLHANYSAGHFLERTQRKKLAACDAVCVCVPKSPSLCWFFGRKIALMKEVFISLVGKKRKFLFTDHRKRRLVRDAIDFLCRCAPGKKWLLCRHKRPAHRRTSTVCLSSGIPSAASHRWETLHSFQCTVSPTKKPPLFCQGGGDDGDEGDPPKWCIIIALFHQVFFWDQGIFCRKCKWNFG